MLEERRTADFPGLLLGADPVNDGAAVAQNVELVRRGDLAKREGVKRLNHIRYSGAITCIPDLQRICDYKKVLVCGGGDIYEHSYPGPNPPPGPTPPEPPVIDDNWPPVACFTYEDLGEGLFRFDASCSWDPDGSVEGYLWTFGDGDRDSGVVVEHQYLAAGDYTVTVAVIDDDGEISTHSRTVSVLWGPSGWTLDYAYSPNDYSPHVSQTMLARDWTGTPFSMWSLKGVVNVIFNSTCRERVGTLNWPLHSTILSEKSPDYKPHGPIYFGGVFYVATKAAAGGNVGSIYTYGGGAWNLLFSYVGGNGPLVRLGSRLFWILYPPGSKRIYEIVGGAVVFRNTLPGTDSVRHIGPADFDGAIHSSHGYYTTSGAGLTYTSQPANRPNNCYLSEWDGALWGGGGINILKYKTATGNPWVTVNVPADPDTGETYDLSHCGTYLDTLFVIGERVSDNVDCILRYAGGYLHEELADPFGFGFCDPQVTAAGFWVPAYDRARMWKRDV